MSSCLLAFHTLSLSPASLPIPSAPYLSAMHTFFSRKARSFLLSILSLVAFTVFFHLYCSDLEESWTSYALKSGKKWPSIFEHDGKEAQQDVLSPSQPLVSSSLDNERSQLPTSTAGLDNMGMLLSPATPTPTAYKENEEGQHSSIVHTLSVVLPSTSSTYPTAESPKATGLTGAIVAAVGLATDLNWVTEIRDPYVLTPAMLYPSNKKF